jgi:hypothetical protein
LNPLQHWSSLSSDAPVFKLLAHPRRRLTACAYGFRSRSRTVAFSTCSTGTLAKRGSLFSPCLDPLAFAGEISILARAAPLLKAR